MKGAALGASLFFGGNDISDDVLEIPTIDSISGVLDTTSIRKSAMERIYGLADGQMTFRTNFDPVLEHPVLRNFQASDADVGVLFFSGPSVGDVAEAIVAKQLGFSQSRDTDGGLTHSIQCVGNGNALDIGVALTPGTREDIAPTDGSGVDHGAATARGLAVYLQVLEVVGTSVRVRIDHSDDDGANDPYTTVTGTLFPFVTAAQAPQALRQATSNNLAVKRWLRVHTTGTFTRATFAVGVTRSPVA